MSLSKNDIAVTSAATYTIPDDLNDGKETYAGLEKYNYVKIDVDGAGSGVITVENGSGTDHSVDTLTDDYGVYPIGGARKIKVTASGGNITFGFKAYSE
jgi:hypothetical protein